MARKRSTRIDSSPLTGSASRKPPSRKSEPPRYEPATLAMLIEGGHGLTAHCRKCGHWAHVDPASIKLPGNRSIPSLEGIFRCTRCGSRDSCAMPVYPRYLPQ